MRCFLDMDGVLADFDQLVRNLGVEPDEVVTRAGCFTSLPLIDGARDAVSQIEAMGYDVWIATKPAPSWPGTYADKAAWVIQHFPHLKKKLIMTQDKSLIGSRDDILVDDRPDKANARYFPGHLIEFPVELPQAQAWQAVLASLQLFAPPKPLPVEFVVEYSHLSGY